MSLFSWLTAPRRRKEPVAQPDSSGLSRGDSTRPAAPGRSHVPAAASAKPANRRSERMARRELLYVVVREAMVRAGVLSSGYKFKVLSLDPNGRQFLVMMDVARGFGDDTARFAEIEAMIAQSAKARHDIVVTAVYWRMNEHVAVGALQGRASARPAAPTPVAAAPIVPVAPIATRDGAPAPSGSTPRQDPLHETEVAAFQQALALGAGTASAQPAASGAPGARSYTLLTGFEDTELTAGRAEEGELSGTQYGQLS